MRCAFASITVLATLGLNACTTPGPGTSATPVASGSTSPSASASVDTATVPRLPYPATPKRAVTDRYHGTEVRDDYQWLEGKGPEVDTWVEAQSSLTRKTLDALPFRKNLRARVEGIVTSLSQDFYGLKRAGKTLFAIKFQPPKQQTLLVALGSADDLKSERVLVDPNVLDPKGGTTIDAYYPSADGAKFAVSLSEGGSESGTLHVYDTASGKETGDVVPSAHSGTAGGSLAWKADGSGFWYTRHPHKGERPDADLGFYQQVYFHKLGTKDSQDTYVAGKDFPKIAEIELEQSKDGKWLRISVQNGDGGEYWHYLLDATGKLVPIAALPDQIVQASFAPDNRLYLRSLKGAPKGKVLRLDPAKPDLAKATQIVPESNAVIEGFVLTASRLYVADMLGGPSQVRVFDLAGKEQPKLALPAISSVGRIVPIEGDDVLIRTQSYVTPPAWLALKAGKLTPTALATKSPVSFDDTEVVRETCKSKDGTEVPVNIVRKKGTKLDGKNPTLLTGYGGYGVNISPYFDPLLRVWIEQGGVYAEANLRGGGEFGEAWHLAGNLTKKQNVFDDFYGCAQHLVQAGYTAPDKLAIMGGSNGGLLMGAAMTQHPEMYRAVVSFVGIYDMLRVELTPNGQFNTTEFGTVKDKAQFDALFAYSPLHAVKDGVKYPALLLPTGSNDPRVDPFHSRKFVARLQAAAPTAGPFLLRETGSTGHGMGTPLSETIEQQADMYAFLFDALGMQPKP